jgi:hypothetical protein
MYFKFGRRIVDFDFDFFFFLDSYRGSLFVSVVISLPGLLIICFVITRFVVTMNFLFGLGPVFPPRGGRPGLVSRFSFTPVISGRSSIGRRHVFIYD